MGSKFGQKKVLGVRDQLARLRMLYPRFRCRVRDGVLIAQGDIQPTALSATYRVRIEYHADDSPHVHVLSPKLEPRVEGGRLPHVYPGNRLCLYLPGSGEWSKDLSLAHTIVPWISEWLFFYETWRVTGEWLGGGVDPADNKTIRNEESSKSYAQEHG